MPKPSKPKTAVGHDRLGPLPAHASRGGFETNELVVVLVVVVAVAAMVVVVVEVVVVVVEAVLVGFKTRTGWMLRMLLASEIICGQGQGQGGKPWQRQGRLV